MLLLKSPPLRKKKAAHSQGTVSGHLLQLQSVASSSATAAMTVIKMHNTKKIALDLLFTGFCGCIVSSVIDLIGAVVSHVAAVISHVATVEHICHV